MLTKTDGEWVVTIGRYRGKLLSWVVDHDSWWLREYAICTGHVTAEEVFIVEAALKVREERINAIPRKVPLAEIEVVNETN